MLIMGYYFGDKEARTWMKFRKNIYKNYIITYNNYTEHTEPLLKYLNLLKVKDMFGLKILKFLFKLYHNELPPYFNIYYRVHLEKHIVPYTLRPHALPVPAVAHVYHIACVV